MRTVAAGSRRPPAPRRRRSPVRVRPGGGDAPEEASAPGWVEPQQQGVGGYITDDPGGSVDVHTHEHRKLSRTEDRSILCLVDVSRGGLHRAESLKPQCHG